MDRYLFLDIDGVLNCDRTTFAYNKIVHSGIIKHKLLTDVRPLNSFFDPIAVMLLKQAQLQLNFKIVISSTWRYTLRIDEFSIMFAEYGWDTTDIIIGATGTEHGKRGEQIKNWLDSNGIEAYQYAIIDDDSDMLPAQQRHFVHTSNRNGLDADAYLKIFEIFGEEVTANLEI